MPPVHTVGVVKAGLAFLDMSIGTTTAAEVERLLGLPITKDVWVDGTEGWIYSSSTAKHSPTGAILISPMFTRVERTDQQVPVKFKQGVVSECTYLTLSKINAPGQTRASAEYLQGSPEPSRVLNAWPSRSNALITRFSSRCSVVELETR